MCQMIEGFLIFISLPSSIPTVFLFLFDEMSWLIHCFFSSLMWLGRSSRYYEEMAVSLAIRLCFSSLDVGILVVPICSKFLPDLFSS